MTFLTPKNNSEANNGDVNPSPYNTSVTWMVESVFIEIYSLLAHRIQGLGWTLTDFWQCDTWTTSKLYCMELELIEEEDRKFNESEDDQQDSDEMRDLYEEMYS